MATIAFYSNKEEIYNTYPGSDLGCTYTPECTTFKVWAPSAEQVLLKLYSTGSFYEEGAQVLSIKQMLFDASTGVWAATIDGDLDKTYYTYVIKTEKGTHETQDVYSKAVGINSSRSEVVNLLNTNPEGWENDRHVLPERPNDAIIWEVHVRDFSSSDTSGVKKDHRGKFLAFTEKDTRIPYTAYPTCVNYLKQLGITHVQIGPSFDFGSVNEFTGVDYNRKLQRPRGLLLHRPLSRRGEDQRVQGDGQGSARRGHRSHHGRSIQPCILYSRLPL